MRHLKDTEYRGHEVIYLVETNEFGMDLKNGFVVDIRADNFDGALIQGYCDLESMDEAELMAKCYIDGLESGVMPVPVTKYEAVWLTHLIEDKVLYTEPRQQLPRRQIAESIISKLKGVK